jgi:hypothetical protein
VHAEPRLILVAGSANPWRGRLQDTRGHKTGTTPTDLRALWQREAAAVGVTPDVLEASIRAAAQAAPV